MRVFGGNPNSSLVGVVQLMYIRVDYSPVQEAVREVESEVLTEHAEQDVHH